MTPEEQALADAKAKADKEAADKAKVAGPTPDPEALRKMVQDTVSEALAGFVADKAARDKADRIPKATDHEDPIRAVIEPYTNKAVLIAEAAKDRASFYASHPEATEYQKDLDAASDAMLAKGSPYTMNALWEWYRGSDKNFDKFVSKKIEAADKKRKEAEEAEPVGQGVRPAASRSKSPFEATDEELNKSLEGVTF